MFFLDASSILSEIVEERPELIPVINRFGIRLGLADMTVEEICLAANINIDFFLIILNTYLNEDYFPERKLQKIDISLVIKYLNQTDAYLVHGQLHNLEKHLNAFIAMSDPKNRQFEIIRKLFVEFKEALLCQMQKGVMDRNIPLEMILDMKRIYIKHISGNYNDNLCYAVVFTIDSLQHDIENHNRIRDKILRPMILELEEAGIENWQELIGHHPIEKRKENELSLRELDVLKLVAQGFINKEIADKLNISLNTVLSHRKNITAKLGIKTVSGLIFYCISHGYLMADEVEL